MGENGLRRLIQKYKTKDFWQLARMKALPQETQDYVPKILAAMLIAKSPSLYGFRDLTQQPILDYEIVMVPGGVNLDALAKYLGLTQKYLKDLNAELLQAYVPREIKSHPIRVPKGARGMVMDFLEKEHLFRQDPEVAMQ
jgi:membrane-bound lytic murein transglycosylase D